MKKVYIKPEVRHAEMELEGFVCGSLQTNQFVVYVDEAVNLGADTPGDDGDHILSW